MIAGMYIKLIAIGILVAAVLGGVWYVRHLQAEVVELTAQNTVLSTKLQDQNTAIDALKKDGDARVAAGEVAIAAAKAEAEKNRGKAKIIYKWKPSTPGDACKSALDLVNGGAQ